jgi:hypothetical protein
MHACAGRTPKWSWLGTFTFSYLSFFTRQKARGAREFAHQGMAAYPGVKDLGQDRTKFYSERASMYDFERCNECIFYSPLTVVILIMITGQLRVLLFVYAIILLRCMRGL